MGGRVSVELARLRLRAVKAEARVEGLSSLRAKKGSTVLLA